MKTNIKILFIIAITIMFFSCKQDLRNNQKKPDEKTFFNVTFSHGNNGTLKASIKDKPFTESKAEKDSIIIFTATPNDGYNVDKWDIQGGTKINGGNDGDTITEVKVTSDIKVAVSFKEKAPKTFFNVTFSHGDNGTLKASIEGKPFTENKAEKDSIITFTATPNDGYNVDKWDIQGGTKINGGNDGDTITEVKVTSDIKVAVSFKEKAPKTLFNITSSHGDNGTLTASIEDKPFTESKAEKDTIITFTAKPNINYKVDKWTITGGMLIEGGTGEAVTAKIKITSDVTVNVTFKEYPNSKYTRVPFRELENYLENNATKEQTNYIEVTELNESTLIGNGWDKPSPLGKILKKYATKKIAIKFGDDTPKIVSMNSCFAGCTNLLEAPEIPQDVEDMTFCFTGCTSLIQSTNLPENIVNMRGCFEDCTNLIQSPTIPKNVKNMAGCFSNCEKLTQMPLLPKGIKDLSYCFNGCLNLDIASEIPEGIENMASCFADCKKLKTVTLKCLYIDNKFNNAFKGCISLENGGIKVPNEDLANYQGHALKMGTASTKFAGE